MSRCRRWSITRSRKAGPGERNARVEAARIIGGPVRSLAELNPADLDGLIIPGGIGATTTLSDYAAKGVLCQVHADIVRLLRALLPARKPMGFIGLSAVLAARVLGPIAGVRVTFGAKGLIPAKHAAIMGADVRPCADEDIIVDQKSRLYTTPGFLPETAPPGRRGARGGQAGAGGGRVREGPQSGGTARAAPRRNYWSVTTDLDRGSA